MPAHTRWIPEIKTMLVSHFGVITADDLYATDSQALTRCLDQGAGVRYVADFRRGEVALTREDVVAHAARMNTHDFWHRIPGLRVAMITDDPMETAFGMVFNRRAEDAGMQIFSTPEGAWGALGLDPAILEQHADLIPLKIDS